jgi:ubiquinone/menaquinone biosynthesis C-methylase UbiE
MNNSKHMQDHFSQVAPDYREVRTTDIEPILFIADVLKSLPEVMAADIGCGAGRYDLLLFQHLKNLHLTCIDNNESMLKETQNYLESHGITNFRTVQSDSEQIPLEDTSLDCILTFNAVHHFHFLNFIKKCAQLIKASGKVFIYTRTRSQNARNIWGQFFPEFLDKEKRLFELEEMKEWVESVKILKLEEVKEFHYKRKAVLEQLLKKVEAKHYSTFSLYDEEQLGKAIEVFHDNIEKHFPKTDQIEWFDENILLILSNANKDI